MTNADLNSLGTTVVVWAHPDDETYLSGGTAAALARHGQRVVAVTATRGEAGGPDTTPRGRAQTSWVRSKELERALQVLGVREHVWLGYEDGCCVDADSERAVRRLVRLFDDVRPDTVLTFGPDGYTGHPDHRAVSGWVDLALARAAATPRLLHAVSTREDRVDPQLDSDFGVFELGQPRFLRADELTLRHVLDPAILRLKVAALRAQASQTAGLVEAVGLERYTAWVSVEGFAEPERVPAH